MTETVNLTTPIERGDTLNFKFNWNDGGDPAQPIDMRGKTIVLTFKLSPYMADDEATVMVSKTPANDDTLAEGGQVVVTVLPSESSKLIPGTDMHYACRVIEDGTPEDIELTHVKGTVPVVDA